MIWIFLRIIHYQALPREMISECLVVLLYADDLKFGLKVTSEFKMEAGG